MFEATLHANRFRLVFYIVGVLVIVMVAQLQKRLSANLFEPEVSSLGTAQQAQLEALYDMDNLVCTLGTALLGGLGFFLVNGRKTIRWSGAMWFAIASAGCSALSLFLGYVLYLALIDMLQYNMFDLSMPTILWVRYTQFYAFLLAVVLFGDFAFQMLHVEDQNERKHPQSGN